MKLALTQATIAIILIATAILDLINGLPAHFSTSASMAVYVTWSSDVSNRHLLYGLAFLVLGIAVLVAACAQFLNARKKEPMFGHSLN
jgi:archaellum biogenesis protein FlaJ (TadC family)